ncbi:uncharacterized protein UDID_17983 [Ustilago sp. UG-2017a]|nr:uncharacterized protein UDID_17983 [Ustilago sp. UG-2017a]
MPPTSSPTPSSSLSSPFTNLITISTHTRPWCHPNLRIDTDRAEPPLNGVSTESPSDKLTETDTETIAVAQVDSHRVSRQTDLGFRRETPDTSIAERKEYPQIVGKLLWLSNGTHPDISQAVSVLARYMTQPNKQQDFLMAHSDVNWASDATAQHKSSSGLAVFVCGNLVAWKSALQRCTALSAVEAEFVATTEAAWEVLFFEHLFRAIGMDVGIPTIFSDNTGTIQVSKDPAQHWKLKHIDTKYHFIRDNVQDRKVRIKYINTADNLADLFTKLVGKTTLLRTRQGLGLMTQQVTVARQPPALPLREAVEGEITEWESQLR